MNPESKKDSRAMYMIASISVMPNEAARLSSAFLLE
jgi:hypothetical protein